jgi:FlaA1/EpsC-like NDP-sugar epimerase
MGEFSGKAVLITGALGTLGSAQTQAVSDQNDLPGR